MFILIGALPSSVCENRLGFFLFMTRCWSGLSEMSAKHFFVGSNPTRVSEKKYSRFY